MALILLESVQELGFFCTGRIPRGFCESSHQREADLRALQGGQAQRRDASHLQAQPQAQAASGL